MVQIKAYLISLDYICLIISGYSFIDILGGNLAMASIDNFVKLLLSMAGFVYLCARTYHFILKSSLDRKFREEEIIEKQNLNFKGKFEKEFIEPFKNKEK